MTAAKGKSPIKRTIPKRKKREVLTEEHELFCQRVALGDSQAEAVRKAWPVYREKTAQRCTTRGAQLMMSRIIRDRVEHYQSVKVEKANKAYNRRLDDVLQELDNIGFANILDYMKPANGGAGLVADFSKLTRAQAAAISAVEVTQMQAKDEDGEVIPGAVMTTIKFKMHDKHSALKTLGGHLGLKSKVELSGVDGEPIQVENVKPKSDTDLARRLVYLMQKGIPVDA